MGLTRYDLEVTNIAAGRAWAETHLANDLPAKVQYIDYTLNGAQLYRFRMSTNEQVGLYERCVEVALQFNSPGTIARALFCLGDAVKTQGKTDRSLTHYREAADLFRVVGDLQQTAVAMAQIADISRQRGQTDEALRIYRNECIPAFEHTDFARLKAVTMGKIADVLQERCEFDEALQIYRLECIPAFEALGDVHQKAVTIGQIANVLQQRREFDEALQIYRSECIPVYKRMGDVRSETVTMGKIADIYFQLGKTDEALRIRREDCLPVYERLGDVWSKAHTMGKIADILQQINYADEALSIYLMECIPVYEQLDDVRMQFACRWNIGRMLIRKPAPNEFDMKEGIEHLRWALATAEKHQYAEAAQLREIVTRLFGGSV